MKKRLVAIVLSLLFSLQTASVLSCAKNEDNKDTDNTPSGQVTPVAQDQTETTTEEVIPYPEANYANAKFNVIVRGPAFGFWESDEMKAEEETGDLINDATYKRVTQVEDMYKVDINQIKGSANVANDVAKAVNAGDNSYDLIMLDMTGGQLTLQSKNMLVNLHEVPNIQLEQKWWDGKSVDGLTIANKLFCATGEITIHDNRGVEAILFNKQMITDLALETPYQLVKDNKWTIDKLNEMSKGVSFDIDGNDTWDENDRYGIISYTGVCTSLFFSSGLRMTTISDDGLPELTLMSDSCAKMFESMMAGFYDQTLAYDWAEHFDISPTPYDIGLKIFQEDRALFNFNGIHAIPNLRAMDTDFGVVPLPKLDSTQQNYTATSNLYACVFASIPQCTADISRTGMITDALARKGLELITPAYYDLTLKTKGSRDDDSKEMLDIIFANLVYDIGFFNSIGGMGSFFDDLVGARNEDLASTYEKKATKMQAELDKFIATYTAVE